MHIMFVTIKVKPEFHDAFIEGMTENAKGANGELGCFQFDVIQDAKDINTVHLYEVYKDVAAFEVHHASAHHKKFAEMSKDWREGPSEVRVGSNAYPADGDWN